jgi:hypothetical protein
VNYTLSRRLKLLDEVSRLARTLLAASTDATAANENGSTTSKVADTATAAATAEAAGHTCETAAHFQLYHVTARIEVRYDPSFASMHVLHRSYAPALLECANLEYYCTGHSEQQHRYTLLHQLCRAIKLAIVTQLSLKAYAVGLYVMQQSASCMSCTHHSSSCCMLLCVIKRILLQAFEAEIAQQPQPLPADAVVKLFPFTQFFSDAPKQVCVYSNLTTSTLHKSIANTSYIAVQYSNITECSTTYMHCLRALLQ